MSDELHFLIEDFLDYGKAKGNSIRTQGGYRDALRAFEKWNGAEGVKTASDLTRLVLRRYAESLGQELSPGGAHARLRPLKTFCFWLVDEEILAKNPFTRVAMPKLPLQILPAVTPEDVRKLLKAAREHHKPLRDTAIIGVLFDTGLRVGELCGLKLDDLQRSGRLVVNEAKGGKSRVVPLSSKGVIFLERYIERERKPDNKNEKHLFLGFGGELPMIRHGVTALLARLSRSAGLPPLTPHAFRRGFAVEYLRGGGDVFTLQSILGHSTLEMTRRYATLSGQDTKNAHQSASPLSRIKK